MLDGKVWDLNNEIKRFEENDFIKIDGTVLIYNNEPQINIRRIRKSLEGEYDPMDYIPSTEKNTDEMYKKLMGYINTINDKYIKRLLVEIFENNKEVKENLQKTFCCKNASPWIFRRTFEHTLSVTEICDFMSGRYKRVNRDILVCCAMLHDIGKIFELSQFPVNEYTDDGQLLGHIIIGYEMVHDAAEKIEGFPKELESYK